MSLAENPFELSGRRALITGAASGIGAQTAVRLAAAGAYVVCVDIDATGAEATAERVRAAGGSAQAIGLDVSNYREVHETIGALGELNILCSSAGVLRKASLVELTEDELDWILSINLKGTLFCAQAVYAGMRSAGGGSIVNLSSAAIDVIAPNLAAYAMSKAAIVQLTRSLATEWAGDGIRVNAVVPGFVDTPMTTYSYRDEHGTISESGREAHLQKMREFAPVGIAADADDIAAAIWFLASDASRNITGQLIRSNSGITMPW
jgi:3-oxoacyl-[acyl-carrier protein] reductase